MSNKVAIVTGAARGIGKACAEKLARDGFDVAILDLDQAASQIAAEEIAATYKVQTAGYAADVTNEARVKEIVQDVVSKWGTVDVLVNNAGISSKTGDICDTDDAHWQKIYGVNLMGTIYCTKAVLPLLKEKKSGRIINMASLSGQKGTMAVSLAYGSSKAAVINLTKSLSGQLGSYNICVNAVSPGLIDTDMSADFGYRPDMVPLNRLGTPNDVAGAVAFLASDDASYITGMTIDVNGGFYLR